jgi:molybdate transport system substrate-binding protein
MSLVPTRRQFTLSLAATLLLPSAAIAAPARPPLTVFAAASLTDALQAVAKAYTARTEQPVRFSFESSGTAARQIAAGARADLFVSADSRWMDDLAGRNLLAARHDLLGGRLALIARAGSNVRLRLRPGAPLAAALGADGRLAVGDPRSVPAGRYAQAALTRLGLWSSVEQRLAPAQDVRAALAYVARGASPLGIVYESDAYADRTVRLVSLFPAASHPPIVYPVAVLRGASAGASDFYRFLGSGAARSIFARYRFRPLG